MMFVLQKAADVVVEDDNIKKIALPVTERSKGMYIRRRRGGGGGAIQYVVYNK